MEELSLREIIDTISNEAVHNMKHSDGEVARFREYFEDNVISEAITRSHLGIKTYGSSNRVSNNIKSALIASEISRNGKLKKGEEFSTLECSMKYENLYYAKKRAQQLEELYLDGRSFGLRAAQLEAKVDSHKEIIDPAFLLKLGVCMQDRMSGYVEDHSGYNDMYISYVKDAWQKEKSKYIRDGLTNTAYFKILHDVFDNNQYKHYTLVHRIALESAINATYKIDNNLYGVENDLDKLYRYGDAAEVLGENVFDTYKKEFEDSLKKYKENKKQNAKKKSLTL